MDAYYSPYRESDGSVTGIAVDIRDITGIKQAEEEASMHRERLAHLVRVQTLGEMATGIAHEINQPLAAIDSYAQASQRHLQAGQANNDKVAELIEKISGQAKRAGSVVSRLRSMMQRRTVNPIPIDINTLLNEVSKIAEIDTKHHNCRLILKFTPSLPNVIGDEIQIQQVALNLIRNAVDAMDGLNDEVEKEIIVKTKRKDNKEVEVSVTDCGFGVTKLDADNIFEAFYTTKDSGLGMGLSICKSIIEDHGGEIGFMQNKAGGATFYFSLPIDKQEV
jgi:two-component system sensor kinase FixL